MQAAKNAGASVKETVSNVVTSTHSSMEKTKSTAQEKKAKVTEKKQEKIQSTELGKQEAYEHNAASKQSTTATC